MSKEEKRQFIINFYKSISGIKKTVELLSQFTTDSALVEKLFFLEKLLPKYQFIPDEITIEDNRVIVRARIKGKHAGYVEHLSPSQQNVESPVVIGYHVKAGNIDDHWFMTDQLELFKQLGLIDISMNP